MVFSSAFRRDELHAASVGALAEGVQHALAMPLLAVIPARTQAQPGVKAIQCSRVAAIVSSKARKRVVTCVEAPPMHGHNACNAYAHGHHLA